MPEHNIYQVGGNRGFVFFNDDPNLSFDPIAPTDLLPIKVTSPRLASYVWSSDIEFYFILLDEGLLLVHAPSGDGMLCRVKSARFIEAFLDAPYPRPARKKKIEGERR